MKNKKKSLKLFYIVLIIAIIGLFSKGYFPSLFKNIENSILDEESSEVSNDMEEDINKANNEEETPVILIEDENIYLNGEKIDEVETLSIKLKNAADSNKKIILRSRKAKLVTYNIVVDILEENEYVLIKED